MSHHRYSGLISNTATVTIVFTVNAPSIFLDATLLTANPVVGSNVQFSIVVRNNGNTNLTNISWNSNNTLGMSDCTYPNFDLAIGAEQIFICQDNNVQTVYDRTFGVWDGAFTVEAGDSVRVHLGAGG
ncbi:hypothetical protein HC776_02400 [bacterium]|nr:hypothetical protein [bacterium]